MSQKTDSNNLSGNSSKEGDELLSEYNKMTGQEAGQDASLSKQESQTIIGSKTKELDNAKNKIDQSIIDAKKDYSDLGSGMEAGILENLFFVLMEVAKDARDDLKYYLGKMKSGGGKKAILGILLLTGLGGLAIAVFAGLRNVQSSTNSSKGLEQVENDPLDLALIPTATPICSINFTAPTNVTELPDFGPVLFEWNSAPVPSAYSLEIDPPKGSAWLISLKETSKTIYMENFLEGGDYKASVHALGTNGEVLCTAVFVFNKLAYVPPVKDKDKSSGSSSEPCVSTGMFDQCP